MRTIILYQIDWPNGITDLFRSKKAAIDNYTENNPDYIGAIEEFGFMATLTQEEFAAIIKAHPANDADEFDDLWSDNE